MKGLIMSGRNFIQKFALFAETSAGTWFMLMLASYFVTMAIIEKHQMEKAGIKTRLIHKMCYWDNLGGCAVVGLFFVHRILTFIIMNF